MIRPRAPLIVRLWQEEFGEYSSGRIRADLVAGLTVAAVALPLALAFGVASSSTSSAPPASSSSSWSNFQRPRP